MYICDLSPVARSNPSLTGKNPSIRYSVAHGRHMRQIRPTRKLERFQTRFSWHRAAPVLSYGAINQIRNPVRFIGGPEPRRLAIPPHERRKTFHPLRTLWKQKGLSICFRSQRRGVSLWGSGILFRTRGTFYEVSRSLPQHSSRPVLAQVAAG